MIDNCATNTKYSKFFGKKKSYKKSILLKLFAITFITLLLILSMIFKIEKLTKHGELV